MATMVRRGKAAVEGIAGSFDIIIYPVAQDATGTHNFEMEVMKDNAGQTTGLRSRDEHEDCDFKFKLFADTAAHAKTGGVLLAPLAVVTVSGCDLADWNTTWIHMSGSSRMLKSDATGDLSVKLRRWVDATQNALMAATPT